MQKSAIINTVELLYNDINQLTLSKVAIILYPVERERVLESVEGLARQLSETHFYMPGKKIEMERKMNRILAKVKDLRTMDRFEKEKALYREVPLDEYHDLKKEVEYFEIVKHEFVSMGKFQGYSIVTVKEMLDNSSWFDISRKKATFERNNIFVDVDYPIKLYVLTW